MVKSSGKYAWDGSSTFVFTNVVAGTTASHYGWSTWIAVDGDPTYNYYCNNSHNQYGTNTVSELCGYVQNFTNLVIPVGAATQNNGNGTCDCHFRVIEPPHWYPINASGTNTVWQDIYPYQYVFEAENIGYGTTQANADKCSGTGTVACTSFNDKSNSGWASGA